MGFQITDLIFCYLMANNQLKCGDIYKKNCGAIKYEWMGLLFVKVHLSDDLFEGAVLLFFKGWVNNENVTKENT